MQRAEKNNESLKLVPTLKTSSSAPTATNRSQGSVSVQRDGSSHRPDLVSTHLQGPKSSTSKPAKKSTAKPWKAVEHTSSLLKGVDVNEMIKLNTKKRDLRTIEEIQADLRRKKGESSPSTSARPKSIAATTPIVRRPQVAPAKQGSTPTTQSKRAVERPAQRTVEKKKFKEENLADEDYVKDNYSSIIRGMFGQDKRKYYDEFDDDDAMEVSAAQMEREERRSNKIGRREDAAEFERQIMKKKKKIIK